MNIRKGDDDEFNYDPDDNTDRDSASVTDPAGVLEEPELTAQVPERSYEVELTPPDLNSERL